MRPLSPSPTTPGQPPPSPSHSLVLDKSVFVDGFNDVFEEDLGGQSVAMVHDGLPVRPIPAVHCRHTGLSGFQGPDHRCPETQSVDANRRRSSCTAVNTGRDVARPRPGGGQEPCPETPEGSSGPPRPPTGDISPRPRPGPWGRGACWVPEPQHSPSTQRQPACRTQAYMSTLDWDMSWSPTR